MKKVEVTFPIARIQQIGHEVPANVEMIAKLRAAGVPIVGHISVQGVENGSLTIVRDTVFGDVVFTWEPGEDHVEDDDPAAGL